MIRVGDRLVKCLKMRPLISFSVMVLLLSSVSWITTGAGVQEVAEDAIESGRVLKVGKVTTLVEHHQVCSVAQVPDPSTSNQISLTPN